MLATAASSRCDRASERVVGSAVLTVLLSLHSAVGLAAAANDVQFPSADGHQLTGSLWANADGPGVLLFHQCNSSRAMYQELGAELSQSGFKVLAIDFRGFGDSQGDGLSMADADQDGRRELFSGFPKDAEAAYAYLNEQGSGQVVGALGASCGGWQVVALANAHPELIRLGFFSSGLNAEHERDLYRMTDRQFLFVVAEGDNSAARPAGTIMYRASGRTTMHLYPGDAHGYPLFEQDPELVGKMVDFFKPLLD